MNDTKTRSYETRRGQLVQVLRRCREVNRYDTPDEEEASTLAHALLDLEESFEKLTHELLPQLEQPGLTGEAVYDILHEVGEEFRHILYHIGDPKYFRYLPAWGGGREEK